MPRKRPANEAHTQPNSLTSEHAKPVPPNHNNLPWPASHNHNNLPTNTLRKAQGKQAAQTEGAAAMEIESVKCECCGLREDCTQDYIASVRASFYGQWLCGLCCEAVRDEASRKKQQHPEVEEAVRAHRAFCRMFRSNPAVRVADGMRQMLRRRSGDLSKPPAAGSSNKYGAAQVGDDSLY